MCPLLEEDSVMVKSAASSSNVSWLSRMARSVAVSIGVELVQRHVVRDRSLPASRGRRLRKGSVCVCLLRAGPWVPLEHREAVLVVHEVAG